MFVMTLEAPFLLTQRKWRMTVTELLSLILERAEREMSEYISPFLFVSIDTMSIESPTSIQENTSSINASKEVEPMLIENPNRFVLFPIQHHDPTNMADV